MSIAHASHATACPACQADVTRPSLLARLVATLAHQEEPLAGEHEHRLDVARPVGQEHRDPLRADMARAGGGLLDAMDVDGVALVVVVAHVREVEAGPLGARSRCDVPWRCSAAALRRT